MTSPPIQNVINDLQDVLDYTFNDAGLLQEALTHPSTDAHQSQNKNYERLEFLGDRVLGLIVAEMLLYTFPDEPEGDLAKRHTALVQAKMLADVARELKLGEFLSLSIGEQKSGGRYKSAVLADAMEAVIGAIYLDGGLDAAKRFLKSHWSDKMMSYEIPPMDTKTELQEWVQKQGLPLPQYVLLERSGPDHSPEFEMEVRIKGQPNQSGISNSKQNAQKHAAKAMLKHLKESGQYDNA